MFFTMADAVDDGRSSGVVDKKRRLDATYAVVGSEFKDKDWGASKTNKPVWEQEARDENGQRRFHGAFTGGFSAGYHNTVGSEEGWAPSSFVSSRTSKAKRMEQTVDSFMDDEDRSEMFSEGLTATKKFNGFFTTADELASRSKKRVEAEAAGAAGGLATEAGGSAPPALAAHASTSAPIDAGLVTPTHKTIGMYLLKKMGWKRGASAPAKRKDAVTFGPKFSHEEIEERNEELFREGRIDSTDDGDGDDDDDDGYAHVVDIVPKNDHYGLGYNPADAIPEYNEMKALREAMAYAGTDPLGGREKKKVPGSGLGLSVLEDDDDGDIYSQESLDMYDREIGGTEREMKRQKNAYVQYALEKIREEEGKHFQEARSSTAGSGDVLCGFVCEAKAPPRRKTWFKPPEVPEDYVPYHYFTEGLRDTISPQLQSILTPQMRTFMLGETPLPRTPRDSVLNLLSIEDRSKFLGPDPKDKDKDGSRSKGPGTGRAVDIRLPEAVLNAPTRIIYKGDPQKQRRFELFLDEQRRASKGATSPASAPAAPPPPDGLSLRAWEAEKLEFMSNAIMMKPVEGPLADTFAPSGSSYSATEKVVPVEVQKDAAQDRLDKAVERKMYGKLTRTEVRWNPNALLCKRFNVPRPRQNVPDGLEQRDSASVALTKALPLDMFVSPTQAGMAMKAGNDNEYNSLLDAIDEQKRRILGKEGPVGKAVVKSGGGREKEEEEEESERDGRTAEMKRMKEQEEKEEEKPPIDLFKAIFENSDEDEEEDEEKKEDEDDKNSDNVKKESISVKQVIKEEKVSNIKEKEEEEEEEKEEEDDVILFGPEMPPVPPPPSFKEDVEEGKEDEDECNAPLPKRSKCDSKYGSSDDDSGSGSSSSSDSDSDRKRHKRHRHKSSHHRHHSHHKHHHSHKRHHHHHHK